MTRARLLEKLAAEVERWNRDNPIGTAVLCRVGIFERGRALERFAPPHKTTTAAFVHEGRSVVWLNGGTDFPRVINVLTDLSCLEVITPETEVLYDQL